jgi:hypothetical protein
MSNRRDKFRRRLDHAFSCVNSAQKVLTPSCAFLLVPTIITVEVSGLIVSFFLPNDSRRIQHKQQGKVEAARGGGAGRRAASRIAGKETIYCDEIVEGETCRHMHHTKNVHWLQKGNKQRHAAPRSRGSRNKCGRNPTQKKKKKKKNKQSIVH